MPCNGISADALLGTARAMTASSDAGNQDLTALLVVWAVWLALCIGLWVWNGLALSGVFVTLGEARWKAWVPVIAEATVLRLGGFAAWNVLFAFLPVANLYAIYQRIVAISRINVVYGKGAGFTVLGILCAPLWATMLVSSGPVSPSSRLRHPPETPSAGGEEATVAPSRQAGAGLAEPLLAGAATHPSSNPTLEEVKPTMTSNPDSNPPALSPYDSVASPGAATPPPPPPPPPAPPAFDFNAPPPPAPPAFDFNAPPPPAPFGAPAFDAPPPPPPPAFDAPVTFDAPPPPPPPAFDAPPPPPPPAADEPAMAPIVVHNPWAPADEATAPEIDIPLAPLAPPPPLVVQPASVPVPVIPEPMTGSLTTAPSASAEPVPPAAPAVAVPVAPLVVDVPSFADEDDDGETVLVDRRPVLRYRLVVDGAGSFPLAGQRILLGRKPVSSDGGVQALAVPDATKTLSKVHARLDLADGAWTITDLGSTNGVVLLEADGTERILDAGVTAPVTGTFVLGKLAMSIELDGPGS